MPRSYALVKIQGRILQSTAIKGSYRQARTDNKTRPNRANGRKKEAGELSTPFRPRKEAVPKESIPEPLKGEHQENLVVTEEAALNSDWRDLKLDPGYFLSSR